MESLVSLAPFLSADSLSRLVSRCNLSDHAEALCALAPFLPQDQLNALFSRIAGGRKHD